MERGLPRSIESNDDAPRTTDPLEFMTDANEQTIRLTERSRDEPVDSPAENCLTVPGQAKDGIRVKLREYKVTNCELTARAKLVANAARFTQAAG